MTIENGMEEHSGNTPVIADFTGDGRLDFVTAGTTTLRMYDGDGRLVWSVPLENLGSDSVPAAAFDFDGDGRMEVVVHDHTRLLFVDGRDGQVRFAFRHASRTSNEQPVIADIDGDGPAEVLVASDFYEESGLYAYGSSSAPWSRTLPLWNQFPFNFTNGVGLPWTNGQTGLWWQQQRTFRVNQLLQPDPTLMFDLVPHRLRLLENPPRLEFDVLNRGRANSSTYVARVESPGGVAIAELSGIALASGANARHALALDGFHSSPTDLRVRISATDPLFECDTANNQSTGRYAKLRATAADGQFATQDWLINIDQVNAAPAIETESLPDATAGLDYSHLVSVADPDPDLGDAPRLSIIGGPPGLVLHPRNGELSWRPPVTAIGQHEVRVLVTDLAGATTERMYSLRVNANTNNQPPIFRSVPLTSVAHNVLYLYEILAEDPEGEPLTYDLLDALPGMLLYPPHRILWTPDTEYGSTRPVRLRVTDPHGAYTDQQFTVTLLHNSTPEITSTPQRLSYPGFAYRYVVIAVDADHDPIGYSLAVAPRGMHIDSHSGQIDWTAGVDQVGSHPVLVWAADGKGGVASQSYTVTVRTDNEPPSITTIPPVVAKVGREYRYDVDATDPEGVTLVYALRVAPAGMQFDADSGLIRWTPTTVGSAAVTVRVDDGEDYVEQLWTINVVDAAEPLVATLSVNPERVPPDVPVAAQVGESGAAGAVTRWLVLDGVHSIPLDANGQANLSASTVGRHTLRATVSDGYETAHVEAAFLVVDASDTTPPVVDLIAPTDNAEITAPTPVRITVQDAQLVEWTLHFRESNSPDAPLTRLAAGTQNVTDAVVAQFDPTVLLNGQYTLYLQATDEGGNTVDDSVVLRVTGDMKIGNFSLTFEEVSIPVAGIPVTVSRTYDTRRRNEALDFGHGWTIDYQNVRVHESIKLGFSWQIREIRNGTITDYCNESNGDRIVTVTLPDGSVESFRAVVVPHCTSVAPSPFVRLAFEPIDGTDSSLQSDPGQLVLTTVAGSPGMMTLIDPNGGGAPIDPSVYELTLPEGLKYELDQNFGIRRVTDLVGNTLTYSNTGVVHSSGIGIDFERNAQGRIDALVLPDGNRIEYDYSASGDLLAARDVLNVATSFAYAYPRAPHYLTTITDGRNLPVVRNEYDDEGRLIASIDANDQRIEFDHQIAARLERVRDRRGYLTTYSYDEEGRVLTETNALNATITRSYDADGNVLTEQDPLLRTRTMTYDVRGNTLTERNDLGETTTSTYDARNNLLTQEDALHRPVISNVYNNLSGALLTTTDALNQQTAFGYDFGVGAGTQTGELKSITDALGRQTVYGLDAAGRGWRVSETDAAGTTTRYTHDDMGRVRTETRPRTLADGSTVDEVTTTTYDEKGRVRRVDHPDGSFSTTEYNAIDKPERECDALSRCTVTTYTARGEVERVTYADNTYEETTYDPNGNTLSQRDRGGRVTRMVYDPANRLTATIYPDPDDPDGDDGDPLNNPRTRSEYDMAGQLEYSFDELSHRTEYRYDDAGRQTHVIDALGHTTVTTYDAAGQRESVTDAEGRTTKFVYDAAGRMTVTIHPDLTPGNDADNPRSRVTYDAAGQKIAAADEMGRTTRYAYDTLGRLERVVLPNPASGVNPELINGQSPAGSGTLTTRYVYDQRGNKTRQIDALERITRFEYDPMGRQTARQLPLGQRETMSYNAAGEQFAKLSFNNEAITMAYDEVSRPRTITLPDRARSFSYTASGQIRQIVDGSDTWNFDYDARDRLKRAEDAFGRAIDYGYDAAGNRTELKTCASVGATCTSRQQLTYAFDELNRLREVVATLDGGVPQTTQYRYSDVGSRSGMTHPNGTVVDYTYDARNRLKTLVHKASAIASAATLLALSYTVDASGLRSQIAEQRPGDTTTPIYTRITDYTYDSVQRLTREQVSGNHGNPDRVHAWTYDAIGNRLTQVATVGTAPAATTLTTNYDYDANDRLLSEAVAGAPSGATTTTHTYDPAGNLTATREGTTTVAQYTWDAEGRLVASVAGSGAAQKSMAYRYDPNGIRRSQVVTDAGGAVTRTEYLVDPNQAYAQVLEEWAAAAVAGPLPDETLATTYVYGDDLISQTKLALAGPSITNVYHYDGLGTTRALSAYKLDGAGVPETGHGEITDRYAYTAFGESDPAGTSGDTSGSSENNYRYTGEQLDPNLGFYYLRARYMDPSQGRFLGMDSWMGSEENSLTLHRYLYSNANPIIGIDPSGRITMLQLAPVALFLAATAAIMINTNVIDGNVRSATVGRARGNLDALNYASMSLTQATVLEIADENELPVLFVRQSRMPTIYQHVYRSIRAGSHSVLDYTDPVNGAANRLWALAYCAGLRGVFFPPGGGQNTCDEYPFASTRQGGASVTVWFSPLIEQQRQGGELSDFYQNPWCPRVANDDFDSGFAVFPVIDAPVHYVCPD